MNYEMMTKDEFAERWDSNSDGGGITYSEIADCALEWGLYDKPKTADIHEVTKAVVEASGAKDKWE